MEEETGKIIERRRLENGMELVLYDRSRVMAGDRWLVELLCQAYIPIDDSYWEMVTGQDPEHLPAVRKMLGEKLVFSSYKKRNFVDAGERQAMLREMVQQVYDSILAYLNRPNFPRQLFLKQFKDCRRKVLIRQAMDLAAKAQPDG